MEDALKNAALRRLPSIDELLASPYAQRLLESHPRQLVVDAARRAVAEAREAILHRGQHDRADVGERELQAALGVLSRPRLRPVLNATGVVLHTNLGRAPLAQAAIDRMVSVARGYANLELDLESGKRGSRYAPVEELLCTLTGAEAAIVVNNCAGAVLLALSAIASGREVVVSRGEAVEIGGGFRVPDVMRQSGATLVEVGTTNKTRLADYERAVTERTALFLKVHRSNFAIVGFTEEASVAELAELGSMKRVPVFHDLGSGALLDLSASGVHEPTAAASIKAGADLVAFSGDKLLGGPQAGILVGKRELVRAVREHPLNRALRIDKLTVAALEATLQLYAQGEHALLPVQAMLHEEPASCRQRAERLLGMVTAQGLRAEVRDSEVQVGAGASPLDVLRSSAVVIQGLEPEALAERLRAGDPAVLGRVAEGKLWLDVRCVPEHDIQALGQAVGRAALDCATPKGQG
ncbi:MAG: L-seryl-tRNA(Sec) selenium transferase [Deltaproteobacteria bacterium]|nr:L-seryl-tRNA(Sec) selenium transferase [Deltaproteobacteria bacterium]